MGRQIRSHPSELVQIIVYQLTVSLDESPQLSEVSSFDVLKLLGGCCHFLFKVVPGHGVLVHQALVILLGLSHFGLALFQLFGVH